MEYTDIINIAKYHTMGIFILQHFRNEIHATGTENKNKIRIRIKVNGAMIVDAVIW